MFSMHLIVVLLPCCCHGWGTAITPAVLLPIRKDLGWGRLDDGEGPLINNKVMLLQEDAQFHKI